MEVKYMPVLVGTPKEDNGQYSLFSEFNLDHWLEYIVTLASTMPKKFYFSELKEKAKIGSIHNNHWGIAAGMLRRNGYTQIITDFKHTKTGNRDYAWERIS